LKLAKFYCWGTIAVCWTNLIDCLRGLLGFVTKLDLFVAVTGAGVAIWLVVAVLVLIESMRHETVIVPTIFYVVTVATLFLASPLNPISTDVGIGNIAEACIMAANIIVHSLWLVKSSKKPAPAATPEQSE